MVGRQQKREHACTDGGPQRGAHKLRRRCACDHTWPAWLSLMEGGGMFESAFAALSRARLIGAPCDDVRRARGQSLASNPHVPDRYSGPLPSTFLSALMLMRRSTPGCTRCILPSFATPRLHETRHLATRETLMLPLYMDMGACGGFQAVGSLGIVYHVPQAPRGRVAPG